MRDKKADQNLNIFELIDQVCADFRHQWKEGLRPRIEDCLPLVTEDAREALFRKLLPVDIRYRKRAGEVPTAGDYSSRFSIFQGAIGDAFDQSTSLDLNEIQRESRIVERDIDQTIDSPTVSRIGDYDLGRELGHGAFGVVYEARHRTRGHRVALKTFRENATGDTISPDRLHRFRKEFRALSEINHPNLVGMQSLEVDGKNWFFTMDLVEGIDFLSYVRPDDELNEHRLRSALTQLVNGIVWLHDQRIIHRDLKPSNVLVEPNGRVVILDFGLVSEMHRPTDATVSRSGVFVGTPRYAAPEQMFGERSEASDWYAIGTMVFEALTGTSPFAGSHFEVLKQKHEQDPPQLSKEAKYPADLSALVDGLLRRESQARLSTTAIVEVLQIDSETHLVGSTRDSHGSSSAEADDDLASFSSVDGEVELIGRERQLDELNAVKDRMLAERVPQVVWITGLSGEGKSSLAEKFLNSLRSSGEFVVLSGRCYDRESVPYKVIDSQIGALVRFLRSKSTKEVDELFSPDIELLVHLFPELRRVESFGRLAHSRREGLDDRQLRNIAFAALKDLLCKISRQAPLVVFVDDLQWGDTDSADVLLGMLSAPDPPALMLLGSYRSDEMSSSDFLEQWNDRAGENDSIQTHTVQVGSLTEAQCAQFIVERFGESDKVSDSQIEELFRCAKGNPYILEQLLEGLEKPDETFKPVSLNQLIERRLQRCPKGANELLNVLAVAGKSVALSEIAKVAHQESTANATITHMRSERLVRLLGNRDTPHVDTYHDKIRESTLGKLGEFERKKIHLALACSIEEESHKKSNETDYKQLSDLETRVFDLAHHFTEADDPRAFTYQLQAGRKSLHAFTLEAALDHLQKAKELKPDNLSSELRFQLYFDFARATTGCGNLSDGLEAFEAATTSASIPSEEARCLCAIAEIYWRMGEIDHAHETIKRAFAVMGSRLPRTAPGRLVTGVAAMVYIDLMPRWASFRWRGKSVEELRLLAQMYDSFKYSFGQIDVGAFLMSCAQCCAVAKFSNDSQAKSAGHAAYAWLLGLCGLSLLSKRQLRVAKRSAENVQENWEDVLYRASAGITHYAHGEFDQAEETLTHVKERLADSGTYSQWGAEHILWHVFAIRGLSVRVVWHAANERQIALSSNDKVIAGFSHYGLAEGLAKQGQTDVALECAEFAIQQLEAMNAVFSCVGYIQMARVQLQIGDYKSARTWTGKCIRDIPRMRFFELTAPAFMLYVEASLAGDWFAKAPRAKLKKPIRIRMALALAQVCGWLFPAHKAGGLRMKGRHAMARGKPIRARKLFDRAIATANRAGAGYEEARAYIDRAMLDGSDSKRDLDEGLTRLENLGCVLLDAEVDNLGIDRDAHHARAKEARTKYAEEHGIPEFDVEAWDRENASR